MSKDFAFCCLKLEYFEVQKAIEIATKERPLDAMTAVLLRKGDFIGGLSRDRTKTGRKHLRDGTRVDRKTGERVNKRLTIRRIRLYRERVIVTKVVTDRTKEKGLNRSWQDIWRVD